MTAFKHTVKNLNNMHARPLSELAKIAKDGKCKVMIKKGKEIKDIKNIINMMRLKLKIGDEIEIIINGDDKENEKLTNKKIKSFFKTNL